MISYNFYTNRKMFIKNAMINAGKRIIGQKAVTQLQNQFVLQLVFLTALKNYLYKATAAAEQNLFIIPEDIKKKSQKNKLILVLDMDQTLVYTRRPKRPDHSNFHIANNEGEDMYVEPRPFASQFLKSASQIFTIYVYTAGKKKYADAVLDTLDVSCVIQKRFYRESCKKVNGNLIKDLRYLKRTLKQKTDMILVDDNLDSIKHNYPFAVRVQAFEGNQEDAHLKSIFKTLLKFYH